MGKTKKKKSGSRKFARRLAAIGFLAVLALSAAGNWFVHHPRRWLETAPDRYPALLVALLETFGDPSADFTDALGLTGNDAVYEYDEEAPAGEILFAGAPKRTGAPAPKDIEILDRNEFLVGWSPSLGHAVWVAYRVTPEKPHAVGKRPSFHRDRGATGCPAASAYEHTGYDRGHLAPNYAMAACFGENAQKRSFLMSNVAPQSPALNRGVWRQVEHRIADLWSARYGEIWVIVGAISGNRRGETLSGTSIDVPGAYYQVIVAQEGLDIRAMAVIYPQETAYRAWPTRGLISIDELETLTGLDFLPELPSFIQDPLEAELPSRLWPIRPRDLFRQIALRFN